MSLHDYNTFVDDYFSKCAVFLLILQTIGTKVYLFSKSNQISNPKPKTNNRQPFIYTSS